MCSDMKVCSQVSEGCLEDVTSLQQACGYCLAVLRECALQLRDLQQQAFDAVDIYNPFMAVKDKYRDIRRHCISHEAPLEALPPCLLL